MAAEFSLPCVGWSRAAVLAARPEARPGARGKKAAPPSQLSRVVSAPSKATGQNKKKKRPKDRARARKDIMRSPTEDKLRPALTALRHPATAGELFHVKRHNERPTAPAAHACPSEPPKRRPFLDHQRGHFGLPYMGVTKKTSLFGSQNDPF